MAQTGVDWVAMLREAATSPLGILALIVIVLLFITLGIGELTKAQRLTVVLSTICLVGLLAYLVLGAPIAPPGSSICLTRDTVIQRNTDIPLAGVDASVNLIGTNIVAGPIQARGALVLFRNREDKVQRFVAESRPAEVPISGRTYLATVEDILENTVAISVCRVL